MLGAGIPNLAEVTRRDAIPSRGVGAVQTRNQTFQPAIWSTLSGLGWLSARLGGLGPCCYHLQGVHAVPWAAPMSRGEVQDASMRAFFDACRTSWAYKASFPAPVWGSLSFSWGTNGV